MRTSPTRHVPLGIIASKDNKLVRLHLMHVIPRVPVLRSAMRHHVVARLDTALLELAGSDLVVRPWDGGRVGDGEGVALHGLGRPPRVNEGESGRGLEALCDLGGELELL